MRRFLIPRGTIALVLFALGACGGDDNGPSGPPIGSGQFTATIDGQAWESDLLSQAAVAGSPGTYTLTGGKVLSSTDFRGITLALFNIGAAGTYPLGVGVFAFGGMGIVSEPGAAWSTPNSGAAGSITITTLTTTRIAGTFEFTTTTSLTPGATGTRTVTDGEFDLPVRRTSGTFGPLPDNQGSRASATIDGAAWNAAELVVSYSFGTLALGISNDRRSINMIFANVTGPGTYPLASPSSVSAMGGTSDPTSLCCWLQPTGNSGSLTVTSLTATRVKGTFSFTLAPSPNTTATGPLVITNGQFDFGLP
ncbi:MAG: DUF6252 family protein [Gemmatimonadota bacterium]|nr:DUF6252 family protein [Gemmatimonadota bacterium]